MFRKFRIGVLLLILVFVALNTWLDSVYSRNWKGPLQVVLYPVNIDGSDASERFIQQLSRDDLDKLETFFAEQAALYRLNVSTPLRFALAPELKRAPPLPPEHGSRFDIMVWSLQLRWFTWRTPDPPGPTPTIRLFWLFHDGARNSVLPHSTGLQKGLMGIAHAFANANMAGANLVVVAHELLHTLSATDKYDLDTRQPFYPDGYADPGQQPLYPQNEAELMAGRIPLSDHEAEQPRSLRQVIIGPLTAREIGWIKQP